jgi:uncharacterized protein (TIGR02452 family)
MSKEELIEVFKDTQELYSVGNTHVAMRNCVANTFVLDGVNDEYMEHWQTTHDDPAKIRVTNRDTLTAAQEYDRNKEDGFVAVLNFASATTPGGGVTKGSTAQEECICRCTTLYPALNQQKCWDKYYNVNRKALDNRGSDAIIYTQDVLVFKDKDYNLLDKDNEFYIDVITCAAPNLRKKPHNSYNDGANPKQLVLTDEELYDIHVKRAKHIFDVANAYGVEYLVLGAFGCGAFKNNPEVVAKAYKDVIPEYINNFKVIDFAIIDGKYTNNYEIFKKALL